MSIFYVHTFIGSWKIGQLGVGDHRFTKHHTVSHSSHEFQMTPTLTAIKFKNFEVDCKKNIESIPVCYEAMMSSNMFLIMLLHCH